MSATSRTGPTGLKLWIRRFQTEAGRQTTILYGAQLASSLLNFVFLTALARTLSPEEWGIFSFCLVSVINFLGFFFDFGIFSAGARLLAVAANRDEERCLLGALLVAGLGTGVLFAAVIAVSGPIVDRSFGTNVAGVLLAAAPLAAVVPLQLFVDLACQGTNRIGALALLRLALPVSGIAIVGALIALHDMHPLPALVAYLGGLTVAVGLVTFLLRPSFTKVGPELRRVARATRDFGLHMYVGRATSMASARLDAILIPYFIGTTGFGVYNMAQRLSDPIATLARSMAMTRFKAFANRTEVSAYILRWNVALLSAAVVGLVGLGPVAILLFLGEKYQPAVPLILPFAFATLFAGLMQPYNMFLGAHGRGRELRNVSLALGVTNLAGLLALVPTFGVQGAAWWASGSMAFNFLLNLYYYRKVRRELTKVHT
jgi:O-antigen/teichoic acid export membrane protein